MLRHFQNNAPELKSDREIGLMRESGKIVAEAHRVAADLVKPGVKTIDVDKAVEALYAERGVTPLFKGYKHGHRVPYPAVTCISINEQVVHGIPGNRAFKEGDLVKIDTACKLNGWCADAAVTHAVGTVRPEWLRMLRVAWESLAIAIEELGRRKWWSEVAGAMERHVTKAGFGIVKQYVGHGIGRIMHEGPQVPNFVSKDFRKHDFRLEPGLVLAVEPMVCLGKGEVDVQRDHWTVTTRDKLPSVHVEHTLAVTARGVEVITAPLVPHPAIPVPAMSPATANAEPSPAAAG